MCSLIFTIRTLPVLIIHRHVRHCHWQWYLARPRWKTSSWVSWVREMRVPWVRRQSSNSHTAAGILVKVLSCPVPCWGIALAGMLAKAVGTAFPHRGFVSRAEASGLERQVQTVSQSLPKSNCSSVACAVRGKLAGCCAEWWAPLRLLNQAEKNTESVWRGLERERASWGV